MQRQSNLRNDGSIEEEVAPRVFGRGCCFATMFWGTYIEGAIDMTHFDLWKLGRAFGGRNSTSGCQEEGPKKQLATADNLGRRHFSEDDLLRG
jgi:hypothetical protein